MSDFKKGDHVKFFIHNNPHYGSVVEKVTEDTQLRGFTVHASETNPQYLIEHDKTHTLLNRHADRLRYADKLRHADDSKSSTTSASKDENLDQDQG